MKKVFLSFFVVAGLFGLFGGVALDNSTGGFYHVDNEGTGW